MSEPKLPAAVVWMERPDGRLLALTRGDDFADWHLPGGKWEEVDGYEPTPPGDPSLKRDIDALIAQGRNDDASKLMEERLVWCQRMPNLRVTACRELREETGVYLEPECLVMAVSVSYVTRSGRPVLAFVASMPAWAPDRFPHYPEGQPAWVPPSMLATPSCSFAPEFRGLRWAVRAEQGR